MIELKKRNAQEEVVGFVLIIVLIAIISLIFLGFQLLQKPVAHESKQLENLLNAMLKYTTDCIVYPPQYESITDLIKSCYTQDTCSNGIAACQYLQNTADKMLDSALTDLNDENAERPLKAYQLNISYTTTQTFFDRRSNADIAFAGRGKCTGNSISAKEILPLEGGSIELVLKFCY